MIISIIILSVVLVIVISLLLSVIADVIELDAENKRLRYEFETFANERLVNEIEIDKIIKQGDKQ